MTDTNSHIFSETFGMCFYLDGGYNLYSAPATGYSNNPDYDNELTVAEWEDRDDVVSNPLKWEELMSIYASLARLKSL